MAIPLLHWGKLGEYSLGRETKVTPLDEINERAQLTANTSGKETLVLNLNRVGSPMYVVRYNEDVRNRNSVVSGPYYPEENTNAR